MKTLCRRLITFIRGDKEQEGRCVGVFILNTMLGAGTQVEECAGRGAVWTASMPSFTVEEGSVCFKKITHVLL